MSRPSIAAVPLSRVRTMAVRILGLTVAFAAMAAGPSFPHGKAVVWRAVPAAGAEFRAGAVLVIVTAPSQEVAVAACTAAAAKIAVAATNPAKAQAMLPAVAAAHSMRWMRW